MSGYLFITEFSNMGDVTWETPLEPAMRVQRVSVGGVSAPFHSDTRFVIMYATFPCCVVFFADDTWTEGNPLPHNDPDYHLGYPIPENTEVTRIVHPTSKLRIATFSLLD